MSFTYGNTNTSSLAGVTATLEEWPSLGGLEIESAEIPGHDGRIYGGITRTAERFEFDVIIEGTTPTETGERRDTFIGLLDPALGPRPLTLETDPDWYYPDVLIAEPVRWERMTWDHGAGFKLRAMVAMETQEKPSARREEEPVSFTGETTFTLTEGNTATHPRLVITPQSDDSSYQVQIGGFQIGIDNSYSSDQRLDLNWYDMEFSVTDDSGTRESSLVADMSTYRRPTLQQGQQITLSIEPERPALFYPNARRI